MSNAVLKTIYQVICQGYVIINICHCLLINVSYVHMFSINCCRQGSGSTHDGRERELRLRGVLADMDTVSVKQGRRSTVATSVSSSARNNIHPTHTHIIYHI